VESYVYILAASAHGPVKIGFSKHPELRLRQLQTGHAEALTLYHKEPISQPRLLEKAIHAANRHRRVNGEWFDLTVEEGVLEVRHAVIRYSDEIDTWGRLL
jgi:hypothetical protein